MPVAVTTMRLVSRDTPTLVLFDFDQASGLSNPLGIQTILEKFDLGVAEAPFDVIKPHGAPHATRVLSDPQVRTVTLTLDVRAPDGVMSTLTKGLDELYRLLTSDAANERLLAWDDGSGVRYFEPLGIENALPDLREATLMSAVAQGEDVDITLEIRCQPYLLSPELDADTNLLLNGTMNVEGVVEGRPDSWTLSSVSNITAEAIDAAVGAYTLTIATTSGRDITQTTAVGTFAPADVATVSFYAKAAVGGIARMRAAAEFANSGGSGLGGEVTSTQVTLSTVWQRLIVTTGAAPGTTSRLQAKLRFENISATSVQVWLRDAQAEKASAASLFHAGPQIVAADASQQAQGLVFPLVVQGTAPTPVTFDIECLNASSRLVSMRMGARWDRGTDGNFRIADYLNRTKWVPAGSSLGGWTVTTENLGGGGANADTDAYASSGLTLTIADAAIGVRLRRWRAVRTTNLDSLRGEWMVYGRFDPRESDIDWQIQMQYGPSNTDPVPYSELPVMLSVATIGGAIDTNLTPYEYVKLGLMRIPTSGNIGAVRMELWIARNNDLNIGTANLRFGGLFLMPYSPRTFISVPGQSKVEWDGTEFVTPSARIATDTAGYWQGGDKLEGGGVRLDAPGESMGVRPNGGQAYGTGRARITFDVARVDRDGDVLGGVNPPTGLHVRIIRTSPSEATMDRREVKTAKPYTLEFDSTAGDLYVPQATHNGNNNRRFTISQIVKRFLPYVKQNERVVADPNRLEVTKRDSSLNIQTFLDVSGQTPFILEPGRYVIALLPGDARQPGHDGDDAPLRDGSSVMRTFRVRTRYSPRWTQ